MARPPVIIIGMHRSGTSMITDVLETLGLFMGKRQNQNQEAMFFVRVNEWLLYRSRAAWDHVEPVDDLLANADVRTQIADYLQFHMHSPRTIAYLGWRYYLAYRGIDCLDIPWGWKDPRNTYTLPIWLDVFPNARVVHVYRNGVDVASSLSRRSQRTHQSQLPWLRRWQRFDGRLLFALSPFYPPFRLQMALEKGFSLWEQYVNRANEHMQSLPDNRRLIIRYEDFLAAPRRIILHLCDFLGIDPPSEKIERANADINPERASAYEHDPELRQFYETVKNNPLMRKLQYS